MHFGILYWQCSSCDVLLHCWSGSVFDSSCHSNSPNLARSLLLLCSYQSWGGHEAWSQQPLSRAEQQLIQTFLLSIKDSTGVLHEVQWGQVGPGCKVRCKQPAHPTTLQGEGVTCSLGSALCLLLWAPATLEGNPWDVRRGPTR